jgi:hypothetical protein
METNDALLQLLIIQIAQIVVICLNQEFRALKVGAPAFNGHQKR